LVEAAHRNDFVLFTIFILVGYLVISFYWEGRN